ncbi:MAG TPA: hypothetical protein DHW49_01205 [Anaerolineae bacterium]|nr:hypothetical protein [Anaerolineae bacterium]
MFEIDSASQNDHNQKNNSERPRTLFTMLITIIALSFIIFYCLLIPATTGQSCLNPYDSNIPNKAEKIFLDLLVNGIAEQDYELLAKISKPSGLVLLKELEIPVTKNYEIISGDYFLGVYEKRIKFDNGYVVHITYGGKWSCPDFFISEQEIFERINLLSIKVIE